MDDKTGTRKKSSAISARPAVRPVGGRVAPASATALQAQGPSAGETQPRAEHMQVIEIGAPTSGPNVKSYIERQLKSVYDDVLNQPIPDRFLDLLNALDGPVAEGAKKADSFGGKEDNE